MIDPVRSGAAGKFKYIAAACAALIVLPLAVVHGVLRGSLPMLDGQMHRMGVLAPVSIERDALGIPTIQAANRVDLAFGTGFVHGQDRFFQMDLSRRLAAGELSELFGVAALKQDQKARIFRFRRVARATLQRGTPEQRAVLEAYTRGVNAGVGSLRSRPWEYWLLGSMPVPWRPEDTILVSHAIWWDLQYSGLHREIVRQEVNARLGGAQCNDGWKCAMQFLYPAHTQWDAPNARAGVVNVGATDTVPSPEVMDVRSASARALNATASAHGTSNFFDGPEAADGPATGIGSNNWALSGRLTATGSALIANDMHLTARVPIVWYRARLRVTGNSMQPAIDMNGVTLPGAPVVVAGSNGHVAWGFTNSYGKWFEVSNVACTAVGNGSIRIAGSGAALAVEWEEIRVRDSPAVKFPVRSGPAGVLLQADPNAASCWFARWLATDPAANNTNLMSFERATTVSQVLALAPTLGIAHQNLVVGDREGHIAWTIAGRVPVDGGYARANRISAWTDADTQPRIVDPEIGRLWSANALATDDPAQAALIGGSDAAVGADYDLGARARQIRDDLLAIQGQAAPADMLRIQLDDRGIFLTPWRTLIMDLLDASALANQPRRAQFKRLVADWNARATVDSVGYRLVRAYHQRVESAVWQMMVAALRIAPEAQKSVPAKFEAALWQLVTARPAHMLAVSYTDWRQFLLAQLDATLAELQASCPELTQCTWGSRRPVAIRHPLSSSVPLLAGLLDMPTLELPGDHDMPRVQDGPTGASERFAVSPGHEEQGYLHMPGGQSGHPLSPYYRAGFMGWAQGTPLSFLPGAPRHRLLLQPE